MGLSLNPLDLFKLLLERNDNDHAKAVAYLEEVVQSARQLAQAWHDTYKQLAKTPSVTLIPDGVMGWNFPPYFRLQEFYRTASTVLSKRPAVRDSFVEGIASLLAGREVTRLSFEDLMAQARHGLFLDQDNATDPLQDLRNSVVALQREVAALEVLLSQFRAAGK